MDTDLLKTFLEVRNTRHFGKAAENLYLTQAAVSARIKQLEQQIGSPLFIRYRNNLQLTQIGERLIPHAESMLIAWERARQDISLKKDQKHTLAIGATNGLWDLCLQDALSKYYTNMQDIVFRAEAQSQEILIRRLVERSLDFAILYEPAKISEILTTEIAAADLILVSSHADHAITKEFPDCYISVDWGTAFNTTFAQHFPEISPPILHTNLSRIALEFILSEGGCAYLPFRMVRDFLGTQLFHVEQTPTIERLIYAAYHKDNTHTSLFLDMVEILKVIYADSKSLV